MGDSSDLGAIGNAVFQPCMDLYKLAETPDGGTDNIKLLSLISVMVANVVNTVCLNSGQQKAPSAKDFKKVARLISDQALEIHKRGKDKMMTLE